MRMEGIYGVNKGAIPSYISHMEYDVFRSLKYKEEARIACSTEYERESITALYSGFSLLLCSETETISSASDQGICEGQHQVHCYEVLLWVVEQSIKLIGSICRVDIILEDRCIARWYSTSPIQCGFQLNKLLSKTQDLRGKDLLLSLSHTIKLQSSSFFCYGAVSTAILVYSAYARSAA